MLVVDGKISITYGSHTRMIIFWYVLLFYCACVSISYSLLHRRYSVVTQHLDSTLTAA